MSLFSSEKKSHGTGGSFLTGEMYLKVPGGFKTLPFVFLDFSHFFAPVGLHVREIGCCTVVYDAYSVYSDARNRPALSACRFPIRTKPPLEGVFGSKTKA
ncbi:MAG: hypothetical protein U0573_15255 [Phycisphaerales bacterium]|nr:hypothetical protein [Planctomycetota bacterium]